MKLAPIVLFVYNRPWHTKQTVEALKKNELAKESKLFVFSDGAKNKDAEENVKKVREYLKTIAGFKLVKIIERKENYGLAKSIISGVTEIVNKYGKIIVLEDDLITSKYFLKYMNEALDSYENENKVASISGYIYPIKKIPETFFIKGADCWGWATWKRTWDLFEKDGQKLLNELKKRKLEKEFDINGSYPFTRMLKNQIKGKNNSWAIRWRASIFLKDKLTLYPGISLVQNIGLDSSGTHCPSSKWFKVKLAQKPIKIERIQFHRFLFYYKQIREDESALKELEKFYKSILLKRIFGRTRREFNKIKDRILRLNLTKKIPYTNKFFEGHSLKSAKVIVPLVLELIQPKSVVDVGCARGEFLYVFKQNGIKNILGIDGYWVNKQKLRIPEKFFQIANLEKPLKINNKFDLVISLEVAEHLPEKSSRIFIETLTNLGPVILFSAAIPFSGGTHHVNEQWPEYWVKLFNERGYVPIDSIRKKIWNSNEVDCWYIQNILLFVKKDYLKTNKKLQKESEQTDESTLSIVHPEFYLHRARRYNYIVKIIPSPIKWIILKLIK